MRMKSSLQTRAIHSGNKSRKFGRAIAMPIFQSSTFEYCGEENSYHDIVYLRLNNTPTHHALHEKMASLENGQTAVVTSSGMSAISTSLLAFLSQGDHILLQDCLYGGTTYFVSHYLSKIGVSFDWS